MRATGIVRRIDDLGRVVIPREIRRTMGIREGEPLEIFTDGTDTVCFKKYSTNLVNEIDCLADTIAYSVEDSRTMAKIRGLLAQVQKLVKGEESEE